MSTSDATKHRSSSPTPSSDRPSSPTLPPASTADLTEQDPEKLSHEAWLGDHESRTVNTDVDAEDMTDQLRQTTINESSPASERRPGISRYDTDAYEDYPSTEPNLPSERVPRPEDLPSPLQNADDDELSTSPYATEHSMENKANMVDSSHPTHVPGDAVSRPGNDAGIASSGWSGATRNEDPAFVAVGSAEHKDLGGEPLHAASATPTSHEHVHDGDDDDKAHGKHEHGHQKEGIMSKVASFLGPKKAGDHEESK